MKLYKITLLLLLTIFASSCEDVITVDLNTSAPRLVIDASIQWQKGTSGNEQKVKLTTTTGFYDTNIPTVSGAIVFVTNSDNVTFNFIEEEPNSGIYLCHNFVPEIDKNYNLTVILNGETYTANETLMSVAPITSIEQNDEGGFTGDEIEVKAFFNDPPSVINYYMFTFKSSIAAVPEYDLFDDSFTQGNENFGLYINEDIDTNDNLEITINGVSRRYYEYMKKIVSIRGGNTGSPFSTPPATVRGNIVNQSNADNYALGYFNLSETDYRNYVIQ
ncbi:DUF4249 domain-containing protein [Flavobacterium sp. RSB2_4_14]|uniref:DUF4249 domain-containing protein n=1 Tax=Flavobacterium sp. RSB2_4_14 TaxID=3447665 RepID=UPI003F2C87BF